MKRICVLGLGYIGLPTASLLANRGFQVTGVDVNPSIIETINQGRIHFTEPDLDVMVHAAVAAGSLKAQSKPEEASVFIIAVPTPFRDGHQPDLSCLETALDSLAPILKKDDLVILESTVPVDTSERLSKRLAGKRPDLSFPSSTPETGHVHISHCPERVLPGQILKELIHNDRIIGGVHPCCAEKAKAFYREFVQGECHVTDAKTAEMTKLAENAFRDVNIAFANEISLLCERFGVNPFELVRFTNCHPRVRILQPGPGVGGHCIAVDPWFLWSGAPDLARLIQTAREVNDGKPDFVVSQILKKVEGLKQPVIACFGLSFKADVEDMRESPSLRIVQKLAEEEVGPILVVEPHISRLPDTLGTYAHVRLVNMETALQESQILVGLVNHKIFLSIDHKKLTTKIIIDTKGMWPLQIPS